MKPSRSPQLHLLFGRLSFALALVTGTTASAQAIARDPSFAVLRRAAPYETRVMTSELADLDGDGDLDAVAAARPAGLHKRVLVLENDGHALFTLESAFPVEVAELELGDLDGDGDTDVLCLAKVGASENVPGFVLLENAGDGTFAASELPMPATVGAIPHSLVIADVDGDGDRDALFVDSRSTWLARNRGDATFNAVEALVPLASTTFESGALTAADFDGDGDVDLAHSVGSVPGSSVALLLNDGTGSFVERRIPFAFVPQNDGFFDLLAGGDVDGNGTVDLFFFDGALHLLLNDGQATFVAATGHVPPDWLWAFVLSPADIDGNGTLDLFTGNDLLLGDGLGFFQQGTPRLAGNQAYAAGDLDRDGDVDLHGGDRVALQDGQGSFHDPDAQEKLSDPFWIGQEDPGPLSLTDLDGDGDLDALGLENDGRGAFHPVQADLREQLGLGGPRFGDFDGDGDSDAYVPTAAPYLTGSRGDRLIRNTGNGRFEQTTAACNPLHSAPDLTMDADVGDVDADGDLDLILARVKPGFACHTGPCYSFDTSSVLLVNDGTGCFLDASAALPRTPFDGAFAVRLGDLEGDGGLDVLTSTGRLYVNGGSGSFADGSAWFPDVRMLGAHDVALGDADGDGDLDAFFSASHIALNDGLGRFPVLSTGPFATLVPGARSTVWLGDLNSDGRLDVVEGVTDLQKSLAWFDAKKTIQPRVNRGDLRFEPLEFPSTVSAHFDVGDVDQDGDLDIFDGRQVYSNLERSLARRAHARIGHPLVLELTGRRNAPYLLIGTVAARAPLATRFGLLKLDLATVFYLRLGLLDLAGRAAFDFALPSDPALVGVTAYWQAILGLSPRLTNLEATEVGAF